jgi:hypothetical protein
MTGKQIKRAVLAAGVAVACSGQTSSQPGQEALVRELVVREAEAVQYADPCDTRSETDPEINSGYGGLLDGMHDVAGQIYMRNDYYDPAGLNSYRFVAGDQRPPARHGRPLLARLLTHAPAFRPY